MVKTKKKSKKNTSKVLNFSFIGDLYDKVYKELSKLPKKELEEVENKVNESTRTNYELTTFIHACINNRFKGLDLKKYLPNIPEYIDKKTSDVNNVCIKDYKYDSFLGEGAYGSVILATKQGKKYAIKKLGLKNYSSSVNSYNTYDSLQNEITISKKMSKLGIGPKLYDYFYCKTKDYYTLYIVIEHMTEGSLDKWLQKDTKHKLSPELKKEIKRKLDIMHKHKVFHGDIAPRNMLLTKKNGKMDIYLGDFGLAQEEKDFYKRNDDDLKLSLSSGNYNKSNTFKDLVINYILTMYEIKF